MAQALKDTFFQPTFFNQLVNEVKKVYPQFDGKKYLGLVYDKEWENRELKQRLIHAARMLQPVLPNDYIDALDVLVPVSKKFTGFDAITFCQFIEEFGLDNFDDSMKALEVTTIDATAEGAIRPFINRYPDKTMAQMLKWSEHPNEHVRRLASEGCRPLLPWNIRLYQFIDDPSPIVPILENLKNDSSLYVRKSVANNLNDLSKNHSELVVSLAEQWINQSPRTDWILKHGLRTLLKQGDRRALALFGYGGDVQVEITNLRIKPSSLAIGQSAACSFILYLAGAEPKLLRLEYAIYYVKANHSLSKKVFQISQKSYQPGTKYPIVRNLNFKNLTTRKHYPGKHNLEIIVNGLVKAETSFELTA